MGKNTFIFSSNPKNLSDLSEDWEKNIFFLFPIRTHTIFSGYHRRCCLKCSWTSFLKLLPLTLPNRPSLLALGVFLSLGSADTWNLPFKWETTPCQFKTKSKQFRHLSKIDECLSGWGGWDHLPFEMLSISYLHVGLQRAPTAYLVMLPGAVLAKWLQAAGTASD